jgi:hypothetical protein
MVQAHQMSKRRLPARVMLSGGGADVIRFRQRAKAQPPTVVGHFQHPGIGVKPQPEHVYDQTRAETVARAEEQE